MTISACQRAVPYASVARAHGPAPEPPASPVDTVAQISAPPQLPDVKRSAAYGAACACLNFVMGPVAHGVGKVLKAVDMLPDTSEPSPLSSPLRDEPAPKIDVPLLIVHGWHTQICFFDALTDKLTEKAPQTGYVKNGQLYADGACTQPLEKPAADMKVFVSVFESARHAPPVSQPQLKANIECIRKLTGHSRLDLVGYSMGGLATQMHLDREEDPGVRRFMMLGTPNQGAGLAGLLRMAMKNEQKGHDVQWLLDTKQVQHGDEEAVEWLRPSSAAREDLHSRWEAQKAKCEAVLTVGSNERITLNRFLMPVHGDGTVTTGSLALPGVETKLVGSCGEYSQHRNLPSHPDTLNFMREFFSWEPA